MVFATAAEGKLQDSQSELYADKRRKRKTHVSQKPKAGEAPLRAWVRAIDVERDMVFRIWSGLRGGFLRLDRRSLRGINIDGEKPKKQKESKQKCCAAKGEDLREAE